MPRYNSEELSEYLSEIIEEARINMPKDYLSPKYIALTSRIDLAEELLDSWLVIGKREYDRRQMDIQELLENTFGPEEYRNAHY